MQGGPFWSVPTGRRDGTVSIKQEALDQIPAPTMNFTTLLQSFRNKSLDLADLVWLSGTVLHCRHHSELSYTAYLLFHLTTTSPSFNNFLKKRRNKQEDYLFTCQSINLIYTGTQLTCQGTRQRLAVTGLTSPQIRIRRRTCKFICLYIKRADSNQRHRATDSE